MSGTLPLAAAIAAMDRAALQTLLAGRRISSPASVQDPLSLALELLRPESLGRAIAALDRSALLQLQMLESGTDRETAAVESLRLAGLLGLDESTGAIVPLPEVTEALRGALGTSTPTPADRRPPASSVTADPSRWFGQALTSVRRSAALLRALDASPARLSRKGAATATSIRSLAEATHGDPETTGQLLQVLQLAALAVPVDTQHRGSAATLLVASSETAAWLQLPYPERWVRLGLSFADEIGIQVARTLELSGGNLALATGDLLAEEYPLLPAGVRDEAAAFAATAETLGFTVNGLLAPPARALLAGDADEARTLAARDFPPPAAGVYLQPDLTVIVPGPLLPSDEEVLSRIAETEQLGAAAALRVTATSLTRALTAGQSTASIRSFLERLSLTGIPQPLDFMLKDLDRRGASTVSAGSTVPAGSSASEGSTVSEAADATAATANADPPREPREKAAGTAAIVERVYAAAHTVPGAGDLSRRLELAIRDRSPVLVTAASGSDERTFTLLPVALTGGRLRATDQQAGVERTLPITAIIAVIPA